MKINKEFEWALNVFNGIIWNFIFVLFVLLGGVAIGIYGSLNNVGMVLVGLSIGALVINPLQVNLTLLRLQLKDQAIFSNKIKKDLCEGCDQC